MRRSGKICFVVHGDFLTEMARTLWADEGTPEKGVELLKVAIPEFDNATIIQILTGEKRIVGDSSNGMELEDDDTAKSQGGNLLSLEGVMAHFRRRERKMVDDMEYFGGRIDLVYFDDDQDERVCALIPVNRVEEFYQGKVDLADIPHQRPTPVEVVECWDPEERTWDSRRAWQMQRGEPVELPERKPMSAIEMLSGGDPQMAQAAKVLLDPPTFDVSKYEDVITSRHGWLSPDGKFYPCQWFEHITLASDLGQDEKTMEKQWVKVSKGEAFPPGRGFTQKQLDLVFDMYMETAGELPDWWDEEMPR